MSDNNKCLIIANTPFHFETCLGLYAALEQLDLEPTIYALSDEYSGQDLFMEKNAIRFTYKAPAEDEYKIGVCVTAHNPGADAIIPNDDDIVFDRYRGRIVFIAHQFSRPDLYDAEDAIVTRRNSLFLSEIATQYHGLDSAQLIDLPQSVIANTPAPPDDFTEALRYFVQGNFNFRSYIRDPHREWRILDDIISRATNTDLRINVCGWAAKKLKFRAPAIHARTSISETQLYRILNESHFVLPLIEPLTHGGTYVAERFSSSFYMAFAGRKPVFCHDAFASIYKCPGIYYNAENFADKIDELLSLTAAQYGELCGQFDAVIAEVRAQTSAALTQKIDAVLTDHAAAADVIE